MRALGDLRRKPPVEVKEQPVVKEETPVQAAPASPESSTDSFEESVSLG